MRDLSSERIPMWQAQGKAVLTKKMIDEAKPHSVVMEMMAYIEHPWFNNVERVENGGNLEDDGRSTMVKIVVFRGGIADWCIYHSLGANIEHSDYLGGSGHLSASYELVARAGDKIHNREVIRAIIQCSDEVMDMYRD